MTKAELIVSALGGASNIRSIDSCTTRLRTCVNDVELVSAQRLMESGVLGIVINDPIVQVVIGVEADVIADDVQDLLSR